MLAEVKFENIRCWQHDKSTASVDTMLLHAASADDGEG